MIFEVFSIIAFLSLVLVYIGHRNRNNIAGMSGYILLFLLGVTLVNGDMTYRSSDEKNSTYQYLLVDVCTNNGDCSFNNLNVTNLTVSNLVYANVSSYNVIGSINVTGSFNGAWNGSGQFVQNNTQKGYVIFADRVNTSEIVTNKPQLNIHNDNNSAQTSPKIAFNSSYKSGAATTVSSKGQAFYYSADMTGGTCGFATQQIGTYYMTSIKLPSIRSGFSMNNQYTGTQEDIYLEGTGDAGSIPVLNGKVTNVKINGTVDYQYGVNINPVSTNAEISYMDVTSTNIIADNKGIELDHSDVGIVTGQNYYVTNQASNISYVEILKTSYGDQRGSVVYGNVIGYANRLININSYVGGDILAHDIDVGSNYQLGNAYGIKIDVEGNNNSNYAIYVSNGNTVLKNTSIQGMLNLSAITLPTCATGLNGTIARNGTSNKIAYCDGATWNNLY